MKKTTTTIEVKKTKTGYKATVTNLEGQSFDIDKATKVLLNAKSVKEVEKKIKIIVDAGSKKNKSC
jgi:hypothetical protein